MSGDNLTAFILIEKRLFWTGRVMRRDLIETMRLSESTAARIFRAYRAACPGNMRLKMGRGGYWEASEKFEPRYYEPNIRDSGLDVEEIDESGRHRGLAQRLMRSVAAANLNGKPISIAYINDHGELACRLVFPVKWKTMNGCPVALHVCEADTGQSMDIKITNVVLIDGG